MGFKAPDNPDANKTTSESKYQLGPEQQQVWDAIWPTFQQAATKGINMPGKYVGFNPLQTQAQNELINSANNGNIRQLADSTAAASNYLLNDAIKVESNPVIADYVKASRRSLDDAFNETVLPGIGSQAIAAGGYGDTRHGVAQGIATGKYLNAAKDMSSSIYNNAYNQGLDAMTRGIALSPTTLNTLNAPATTLDAVGSLRRQDQQLKQQDNFIKSNWDYLFAQDMLGMLGSLPGGTQIGTVTGPPTTEPSMFSKGLGGGMAGLGMVGSLASAGMAVNPMLGLGLGALGAILS